MNPVLAAVLFLMLTAPAPASAQTPATPPPQTPAKPATPAPAKPRPRPPAAPQSASTVNVVVTDSEGRPIDDVTIMADGPLNRSGSTDSTGTLRFQGLRVGTYRMRFDKEGFLSFEREVVTRAGTKPMDIAVTLTAAPAVEPPPPPPPPPPAELKLPPPGNPKTLVLPDWIESNFISSREPQKESLVGCSGLGQALVWQIREPWTGRQHTGADGMLYVVGGEGTLRLGDQDVSVAAGSFAIVPRGTSYSLTRRGRNPLIVLAVLAGAPCAAN
jgi:hypothetical protein